MQDKRPPKDSNRIRIHQHMSGGWVWRLLTPDGHVAQESESFGDDRAACEDDAKKQGLPVVGLMRKRGESPE
jgi:hypothetical protein